MMVSKLICAACLACAAAVIPLSHAIAADVGVMNFTFDAPHRDRLVQVMVWYPAEQGGRRETIGDDILFQGVTVKRDAKPARKQHPLVLLSHGSGHNAPNMGWVATRLAAEGYIVAAPTHQGTTSADSRPETTITIWQRPQDMTELLDRLRSSPSMNQLVDLNDVTAMGFSLGGHTALALAGARVNAVNFARYCDAFPTEGDCIWYARGNPQIVGHVDLHRIDAERFESSFADPRIKRLVVIDPAFAQAFDASSLKGIKIPSLLLSLGAKGKVPTGVEIDTMSDLMPNALHQFVEGANHFSFMDECKAFGFLWLWLDGDGDPLCTEIGNRSRAELHDEIARKIIGFLKGAMTN